MIRAFTLVGMCVAGVSMLGAQEYRPGIGGLARTDVFLDGTDMGDSSRSLTTVATPLRYLGPGLSANLSISFAMGMDRHDTTYSLVLNGSDFDSLFVGPAATIGIIVDGRADRLVGRRGTRGPPAAREVDHIWYRVPLSLLREVANGKVTSIRIVHQDQMGDWGFDDSSMALLRRFLGMADVPRGGGALRAP